MDTNKGKRKGMDRGDERAEKKMKIEINEEFFRLKYAADCAKVAEAGALESHQKAVEAEKAAKKKVEEAKDDLKLKQQENARAEGELNAFIREMELGKNYSESVKKLKELTKNVGMNGYGHRDSIGYGYDQLMNEETIGNVLDFLIKGATSVHLKLDSWVNVDVKKDGWRLFVHGEEYEKGNRYYKGRHNYEIQLENNGKLIHGNGGFSVDVKIFDEYDDCPKRGAEVFLDNKCSETVGEGKERVTFYVRGHKVGAPDHDHRTLVNITMN
ncbi:Oidioi.mRNA.OKI2018_I69.PAR.g11609.t1.cds [Oikopleura dioica]|uniref:Oidioi.mRNA.OKI2018_I69.PAR.g11609.t1.cds n=1 Tax=Oikopleura dioica TaxID=34765 RepID=A0ABN7S3S5_OIKDI|nr:Oidioi.mRNA.OKI2018_I69.PAR.g11609.t1.cds [Oikopleura dioica]